MGRSSHDTAHWGGFAGLMILIAGTLQCVWVTVPVGGPHLFAAGERYQLTAMGWIILTVGVAQALAAVSIWTRERAGRRIGITAAMCGAMGALACFPAIPLFSLCVLAIELLVAYVLVAFLPPGRPAGDPLADVSPTTKPPPATARMGSEPSE